MYTAEEINKIKQFMNELFTNNELHKKVITACCCYYNEDPQTLFYNKTNNAVKCKRVATHILMNEFNYSIDYLSEKHHESRAVIYAWNRKCNSELHYNTIFQAEYNNLISIIK